MRRILVVEDDPTLNRMICAKLSREDYQVFPATDGQEALDIMAKEHVDLIISDVMMPNMDGYTLIKELRQARYHLPVLMITAKGQMEDMEKGFEAGTDDYMVKPINLKEMILRVGALLRRADLENEKRISFANTVLDYSALTVETDGVTEHLPPKEFYLLFKLLNQPNKIFTRQELLDEIWGMEKDTDGRNVDAHIKKLRRRFADHTDFEIMTVRGLGYKAVFHQEGTS